MKTITKLLKITGTLCLSCVCLTSKAEPKNLTLEELRALLEEKINPSVSDFVSRLKKSRVTEMDSLKGCSEKLRETLKEIIDLRNKQYKLLQGAIATVEYNTNNEPTVIQILGPDLRRLHHALEEIDTAREARLKHEYKKGLGVKDDISRQVSKKTLKQYRVTDEKLKLLENGSVYEITLGSILSSRWFSKEMQKKGKDFFYYSNFVKAVDQYTDNVTILKKIQVVVKKPRYHLKYDEAEDRVQETWGYWPNSRENIVYKLSGSQFEKMQVQLYRQLKDSLKDYKKQAAVILFLLFDEMTPPEYRVQWVQNQSTSYAPSTNRISLENVMEGIEEYLQTRLGLNKSFEGYQKEFKEVFPDATENNKATDSSEKELYLVDPRFCFVLRKPQELVTLEQLNEFITEHLEEYIKKNIINEPEEFEEFEEEYGYIKTVTYDTDEFGNTVPTLIEYKPGEHMDFLRDHLDDLEGNPICRNQGSDVLKELSREVKTEKLEKYGITDEELKLLGGKDSIRKITFNSILESNLFNNEQKIRGCDIYLNLSDEIEVYVNKAVFVNSIPVILRDITDNTEKTISFTYKVSGKALEETRKCLREALHGIVQDVYSKTVKVSLLLLLDEITPPEYRVLWRFTDTEGSCYKRYYNIICVNKNNLEDISHEIGHHLQKHLNLPREFEGFENTFAKKLLLLESEWEKSNKTVSLPKPLSDIFKKNDWGVPEVFTENDLFMRWQLFSRWTTPNEVSNRLGLYFDRDGKLYVNMLSDADTLMFKYGHTSKGLEYDRYKEKDENEFKNPGEQSVFEEIVKKAAELKPDLKFWNIVIKLHEHLWRDEHIKDMFDEE